jgi:hypothetical protein
MIGLSETLLDIQDDCGTRVYEAKNEFTRGLACSLVCKLPGKRRPDCPRARLT